MQENSMQNQYSQFTQNPLQFIMQRKGISIPQEFQNDPHGAVQYLLDNGQMSQAQLNRLSQIAQSMGIKL
jgi:hypothetical protein